MTATITDPMTPGLHWSGDTATYNDRVENGPAMAAYLGRSHSPASRAAFGILWDDRSLSERIADPEGFAFTDAMGNHTERYMLCIGIVEEREGGIWTGRTASGALDGATVTPI